MAFNTENPYIIRTKLYEYWANGLQLLLHKFKIIKPPNMLKLNHYTTLQTRRFQDISLKTNRKGARDRDHTRAFKCVTIFTGLFYSTH